MRDFMKKLLLIIMLFSGHMVTAAEFVYKKRLPSEINRRITLIKKRIDWLQRLEETMIKSGLDQQLESLEAQKDEAIDWLKILETLRSRMNTMSVDKIVNELDRFDQVYD
jgi:hypothetical protein